MCLLTPDMRNRQLLDAVFTKINTVPNVVMEASGFTAVFAQVASGNAATIAPVDLAKTFLALSSTQQFSLTNPEVIHSIGFSVKDQSPVLPMIQALQKAINAAL
jgi:DNA-binding transcriptional LysR family regulator